MPRSPEKQREAQRTRYADYKRLVEEFGVEPRRAAEWRSHYHELLGAPPAVKRDYPKTRRAPAVYPPILTREQLKNWWLENFTLDQIRELASGW